MNPHNDESRLIGSILSEDTRKKLNTATTNSSLFERSSSAPPVFSNLVSENFDPDYYAYYLGNRAFNPRLLHPLQPEWSNLMNPSTDPQSSLKLGENSDVSRNNDIWSDSMNQKSFGMDFPSRTPSPGFRNTGTPTGMNPNPLNPMNPINPMGSIGSMGPMGSMGSMNNMGPVDDDDYLKMQQLNGTSSGPGMQMQHHQVRPRFLNNNAGEEEMVSHMQNLSLNNTAPQYYNSNHYQQYPNFPSQNPSYYNGQMNTYSNPQQFMQYSNVQSYSNNRMPPMQRNHVMNGGIAPMPQYEKNAISPVPSYTVQPAEQITPGPQISHPSTNNWERHEPQQAQNPPQHHASSGSGRGGARGHSRKNRHVKNKSHNDQPTHTRSKLMEDFKKTSKKLELKDIVDHVVEFSRDQHGSRFIQQKLESATLQEKDFIFEEIKPEALSLMTDVFGNYVIQKFFDYGSKRHKKQLASELAGNVLNLTLQTYGCRVIQKALEVIDTDDQKIIGDELKNHVIKCVLDQNGNHVIQKCIERMSPSRVQFIVDSFCNQIQLQSRHAYGCRVIQRMLEHCTDAQTAPLLEEILGCVQDLVTDQYGNYVVQHVLEHGKPEYRSSIIKSLRNQFAMYSVDKYASNVVEKSFVYGTDEERDRIIIEITSPSNDPNVEDPILAMMNDQYANFVIQKIIEASTDDQRMKLIAGITPHLPSIRSKTFGKHIISCISNYTEVNMSVLPNLKDP